MTPSTEANIDLAARLRLSVVRTARRMRQEAGTDVSPSQTAALATIERHGPLTPSELREDREHQAPHGDPGDRAARGRRLRRSHQRSRRRAGIARERHARGSDLLRRLRSRKNAYLARRMRDLSAEDLAALDRAADVLERMLEDGR